MRQLVRDSFLGSTPQALGTKRRSSSRNAVFDYRADPPDETWARATRLFAMAGVTRVADLTGLDRIGIPVFEAYRPFSRNANVALGKGISSDWARVSAAMEGLELWRAELIEPDTIASAYELRASLPYDPMQLPLAKPSLYNRALPIAWSAARGVVSRTKSWVPHELVQRDLTIEERWLPPVFSPSSNGLASGNTQAEAIMHALFELIERDSLARHSEPAVVLDHHSPTCPLRLAGLVRAIDRSEVEVVIHVVPNRFRIPCFQATIWSDSGTVAYQGSGCHCDPEIAASRAVTEAAQSRLAAISAVREDLEPYPYGVSRRDGASRRGQYVRPHAMVEIDWLRCLEPFDTVTLSAAEACVADVGTRIALIAGPEPQVVDLGALAELHFVRVVAPGLLAERPVQC
jgi:ribosomal protein S12 methylthiotransferase accessory factor